MATELLKTPSDTTVLTKEFLDNIGANNYQDALGFLTSAINNAPVAEADYGNAITFRGAAGGYPARNYFRNLNSVDFYIAESLESARGPNALLFGDGAIGGVLDTNTKRAKIGRTINQVKLSVDNLGGYRATLDVNRLPRVHRCGAFQLRRGARRIPGSRRSRAAVAPPIWRSPTGRGSAVDFDSDLETGTDHLQRQRRLLHRQHEFWVLAWATMPNSLPPSCPWARFAAAPRPTA